MTEWPKNPELYVGGALEPVGPLNVFIEKLGAADAINRAIAVKTEYDATHTTPPPEPPPRPPDGPPVDPGNPVVIDESKYLIDTTAAAGYRRR